jgi:hypothetical protein
MFDYTIYVCVCIIYTQLFSNVLATVFFFYFLYNFFCSSVLCYSTMKKKSFEIFSFRNVFRKESSLNIEIELDAK